MLVNHLTSFGDTRFRFRRRIAHQQLQQCRPIAAYSVITVACVFACFLTPASCFPCLKGVKCLTVLTDPFAIISTPNFPHRFETPYVMEWIIDAYGGQSAPQIGADHGHIIYVYLNQMYLKTNFTVTASTYSPYDTSDQARPVQQQLTPHPRISTTSKTPYRQDIDDGDVKVTYFDPSEPDPPDQYYYLYDDDFLPPPQQQQQQRNPRSSSITSNSIRPTDQQQQQSSSTTNVVNNSIVKDILPQPGTTGYPFRAQSLVKSPAYSRSRLSFPYDNASQQIVGPLDCGKLSKSQRYMSTPHTLKEDDLRDLGLIFTTCRYLSLKIEVYSPYTSHIRVRDHLLDVYGFNISYAVNDIEEPPSPSRCSASNCTYNGHCFLSQDSRSFACHCHKGSEGRNCEYDEFKCNPAKNITFCQNGAECRLLGAGHGMCYCPKEYEGQLCDIKKSNSNYTNKPVKGLVCPGWRQCQEQCEEAAKERNISDSNALLAARYRADFQASQLQRWAGTSTTTTTTTAATKTDGDHTTSSTSSSTTTAATTVPTTLLPPSSSCSCEPPPYRPADWVLYDAILQASPNNNFPNWEYKSTNRYKKSASSLSDAEKNLKSRIEGELMRRLRPLYTGSTPLQSVTVTSFSSQSQFSFKFFGPRHISPDVYELLANVTASGQLLPELHLLPSVSPKVLRIPQIRITNLTVNEPLPLQLNHGYSLTCTAEGSEYRSFKWFKDGVEINATLANRTIERLPVTQQGYTFTTHLHVDHSATADFGVFTCQVSDFGNQQTCRDLSISVITQPIIEILPRSLTLFQGENGAILCAAAVETPNAYTYTWYKNGKEITDGSDCIGSSNLHEVTEPVRPYGLLLRIVNASESATFTCKIVNPVGVATDDVYVHVLPSPSAPSCRSEIDKYNLKWNLTGLNQTARTFCPTNYTGFAQRMCHDVDQKPVWGSAFFSRCIANELRRIYVSLKSFVAGFSVLGRLTAIVEAFDRHISQKRNLYPGEGEKILMVLTDLVNYAVLKSTALRELDVPQMVFQITSHLLKHPGSCVEKKSILNLMQLTHKTSQVYYSSSESNNNVSTFQNEVLVIDQVPTWNANDSQLFPKTRNNSKYPSWLNVQLHILSNSTDSSDMIRIRETIFVSVYRNVTELFGTTAPAILSQSHSHHSRKKRDYSSTEPWSSGLGPSSPQYLSSQIGSPIFYFTTNFTPKSGTHYFLTFTLNSELSTAVQRKRKKVICGSIDDDLHNFDNVDDIPTIWVKDNHQCALARISGNIVHCRCDRGGQYALLIQNFEPGEEMPEPSIHWFILFGSVICILCCAFSFVAIFGHLHCQIGFNSIYILKVIVCLSLIASLLFALPLRTTESSLVLSSLLCSSLIVSICCQLTKTLHILLSTNHDLLPWLRSISSLSFVLLTSFTSTLPIWISATVLAKEKPANTSPPPPPPRNFITSEPVSVYDYNSNLEIHNSVLRGESPLFISFVVTIFSMTLLMLIVYYKASMELRRSSKADISKAHLLDQRLKALNRAVLISIGTIIMVIAIVLHDWEPESISYQYFYGFSTIFLGIIVMFSYTIYSEYPIPKGFVAHLICVHPMEDLDLDKAYMSMNGSTNNNIKTRTPQQARALGVLEARELTQNRQRTSNHHHQRQNGDEEELDDLQPCIIPQRYRNNTFSSQNSSEMETFETYGGSSLVSNNGLSMQAHQNNGRHNSIGTNGVKRTNSVSSAKRSSVSSVQFNIPRSFTNPQPSSSNGTHCFPTIVMNGRMKNSSSNNTNTTTGSSCSCGNCPHSSNGQVWSGIIGTQRQRSNSNNSMGSLFGYNKGCYAGKKPVREVCRLQGLDARDTASYVPPSIHSTCSFPSSANSMHRPSGPISFVNSAVTKISPPQSRRKGEDYPTYVHANPSVTSLPQPTSSASSSAAGTPLVARPELPNSFLLSSFAAKSVAGGSSGNCSNNSTNGSNTTLTNETNLQQDCEYGSQFDYSRRPSDSCSTYPRNGFSRQLPLVPPYASTSSAAAAKHIYAEPNLQAIQEKRMSADSVSPVPSIDMQPRETAKVVYATPHNITSPRLEAANKDAIRESDIDINIASVSTINQTSSSPSPLSASTTSSLRPNSNSYQKAIANGIIKSQAGNTLNFIRQHPDYTPMDGVR